MNTKFYTPPDCKLSEGARLHAHLFSYSELTEIVCFFFLNWTSSVKMKITYTMTIINSMMFSAKKGQVKKKILIAEMTCNH